MVERQREAVGPAARAAITDPRNDVFVSAASAWELATKVRRGKLPEAELLVADFHNLLAAEEFETLMVTTRHGLLAGGLVSDHNDPFGRMIAAKAQIENMSVVKVVSVIAKLCAPRGWQIPRRQ